MGIGIALCFFSAELELEALSQGERAAYAEMHHERRRRSWLRGRGALKTLLLREGRKAENSGGSSTVPEQFSAEELRECDSSLIKMPHPSFSLSHCEDIAVAACCPNKWRGLGVDLEGKREIREASAKFFLSESERRELEVLDSSIRSQALLRLWTVKEALFKSDLQNQGLTILKYRILDPLQLSGRAWLDGRDFRYSSVLVGDYWLTLSIAQ